MAKGKCKNGERHSFTNGLGQRMDVCIYCGRKRGEQYIPIRHKEKEIIKQKFTCTVEPSEDGYVNIKYSWFPELNIKDEKKNNAQVLNVGFAIIEAINKLKENDV